MNKKNNKHYDPAAGSYDDWARDRYEKAAAKIQAALGLPSKSISHLYYVGESRGVEVQLTFEELEKLLARLS